MSDFTIINSVFGKLIADATFLAYFGLTSASTMGDKVAKIQKELDPNGLTTTNIPLCCIYPMPGVRSRQNLSVYDGMFEVAIFSDNSTGVKSATTKAGTMRIGETVIDLLHQQQLAGSTFLVEYQTSFQTSSNVVGIKKYILRFKVSEVID